MATRTQETTPAARTRVLPADGPADQAGTGSTIRRRQVLRAVLQRSGTRPERRPWRGSADLERQVSEVFVDEADLLRELHRTWLRALVARLHTGTIVAERIPWAVRGLYLQVAAEHATLRRLLDQHADHPALATPVTQEHAMLARIAGIAGEASPGAAAALGRALVAGGRGAGPVPHQRAVSA